MAITKKGGRLPVGAADISDTPRLSMNISFTEKVKSALEEYCESNGLPNAQDAVRIFVAKCLKHEGFLKQ